MERKLIKNEICEVAPRPTPFTFSLLKRIYSEGGPVAKAYAKLGVKYKEQDFLVLAGGELYIDEEKEKKTLAGSLVSGFFNGLKLTQAKTVNFQTDFLEIKDRLLAKSNLMTFGEALDQFLADYELVFRVNFLSGMSLKKLEIILKKEINLVDVLSAGELLVPNLKILDIDFKDELVGNSLEINDESAFTANKIVSMLSEKVKVWWESLPLYKKNFYTPYLEAALCYERLREIGRWLVIKDLNLLRKNLFKLAPDYFFKNSKNLYFATIEEILTEDIAEAQCRIRQEKYENPGAKPVVALTCNKPLTGVSSGQAEGILITASELGKHTSSVILYSEVLSPDLVTYFNQIKGIVAASGGLLSHSAIVAREKGLPVLVNFNLLTSGIKLGDQVKMDGSSGSIKKI